MSIWDDIRHSYVSDAVAERVKQTSQKKQQTVAENSLYKKASLDPNYRELDKESTIVIDGDTVYDTRTKEMVRVAGQKGTMLDTFETGVDRDGSPNFYYESNPARFKAHAKAFARQAGMDIDEVTPQHLYEAGQGQKQALQDRLESMHGTPYRIDGKDSYGKRVVGRFEDPSHFDYINDLNAGYFSKYNSQQRMDDIHSGKSITDTVGDRRRWYDVAIDGIEGAVAVAGKLPFDTAKVPFMFEGIPNLPGVPLNLVTPAARGVDALYNKATDRHILDELSGVTEYIDSKREGWKSEGQQWQDSKAEIRRRVIQEPLYESRVKAHEKAGHNPLYANTLAWLEGARDNVGYALDNPATIATTSIESLPYFIGSAAVSRMATKGLAKQVAATHKKIASGKLSQKELLTELRKLGNLNKQMGKAGEKAAIGFTGVSEGASNAVSSYDKVMQMDIADLRANPLFQQALQETGSEEDAQRRVAGASGAITFAISGVLAGAANKFTGAAKIEAGLFRSIGKTLKPGMSYVKKLSKDAAKQFEKIPGRTGKVIRGTGKGVGATGKATKKVVDPAAREGVEEIIQSGGGEAVSQEVAVATTGDESHRNPAASAEAAAAGLLSGAATGGVLGNISTAKDAAIASTRAAQRKLSSRSIDKRHQATSRAERKSTITNRPNRAKAENTLERASKPAAKAAAELDTLAQDYTKERGKDEEAPVVDIDQVETFYEEYEKGLLKTGIPTDKEGKAKHERIVEYVKSARRVYKQRTAEGAKKILHTDEVTPEVIAANEELFRIVRDGVVKGGVKLPTGGAWDSETGKTMTRILSMDAEIAESLNELDEAAGANLAQEEGNIAQNTRPGKVASAVAEARRVNAEKLGEGNSKRLGMRGYFRVMGEIIRGKGTTKQKRAKFNAMNSKLTYFINSQEKRHERITYLVQQYHKNGAVTAADEAKINEGEKFKIFWNEPREDGSGGTPALLNTMRTELIKMREIQGKINESALILDPKNEKAVEAAARGRVKATEAERKANIRLTEEETDKVNKETVQPHYPNIASDLEMDGYSVTRFDFLSRLEGMNTIQELEALIRAGYRRVNRGMEEEAAAWALGELEIAQEKLDAIIQARQKAFENQQQAEAEAKSKEDTKEESKEPTDPEPQAEEQETPETTEEGQTQDESEGEAAEETPEPIESQEPPTVEEEFTPEPTAEEQQIEEQVEETKEREGTTWHDYSPAPRNETGVQFLKRVAEASKLGIHIQVPAAFHKLKLYATKLRNAGFVLANALEDGSIFYEYSPEGGRAPIKDEAVPDVAPTTRIEGPEQAPEVPKAPAELLEDLVNNLEGEDGPGLSREHWEGHIDPEHFKRKVGIKWLFPKKGGLSPDGLLTFLKEGGYGLYEGVDVDSRPDRLDAHDALDLLLEVLDGERRVVSAANQDAENANIEGERAAAEFEQQQQEDQRAREQEAEQPPTFEPDFIPDPEDLGYDPDQDPGFDPDAEETGGPAPIGYDEELYDERPTPEIEYTEEEIEAQQIAYHEVNLHLQAVEENSDINPEHIVFTGEKLRAYWNSLVAAWKEHNETNREGLTPDPMDVKAELLKLKALQEESFAAEGLEAPKAKVEGEHTTDVTESAETLSDPTKKLEAQTSDTKTENGTIRGFLSSLISMRLMPSDYRTHNAAVGLWKIVNVVRQERGDAPLINPRGKGKAPAAVLHWLKEFNEQAEDGKLPKEEQKYTAGQRIDMRKPWLQYMNDIRTSLHLKNLPMAIKDFIGPKSATTRNILNRRAPFFEVIADYGSRINIFRKAGLSAQEQTAMGGIGRFVQNFTDTLFGVALGTLNEVEDNQPGKKNVPWYKDIAGKELPGIWQPLREYGLQWLMGMDGSVDPNLAAAMALVGGEWVASSGTQTLWNDDDVINKKLGRPEGTEVTPEEQQIFRHGTLLSNVVQDLGYRIIRQMNLTSLSNEHMDPAFMERLAISLGLMTLATMEQQGIVELYHIPRELFIEHSGNTDLLESSGDFSLVRLQLDRREGDNGNVLYQESGASKTVRMYFGMGTGALKKLFDIETVEKGPHFEEPEVPKTVDTGHTRLPAKMIRALKAASSRLWQPIASGFEVMAQFDETTFKEMMGWMSPEQMNELHKDLRTAQESKNSTIEREIEHAREWYSTAGKSPFHFAYKIISSGRIYINSTTVNPQASKIHRFLFAQQSWTMKMPIGSKVKDPKRRQKIMMLKVAVAQGLGVKVDEQSLEDTVREVDALLDEDVMKKALRALKKKNLNGNDQALIAEAVAVGGEGMHSLLALKTWAEYTQARNAKSRGGKAPDYLEVTLPIEIDGKTNGFAIGLLQTPVGASLRDMLQATGLYTKEDRKTASFIDFKNQNKQDNYEQMSAGTTRSFDSNTRDGELNQEQRKDFIEKFNLWEDDTEKTKYSTNGPKYKPIDGGWPVAEGFWWKLNADDLMNLRKMLVDGKLLTDPNDEAEQAHRIAMVDHLLGLRQDSSSRFRLAALGSFLTIDRNFAKNPLMISAYGAGMKSLRAALGNRAVEAVLDALSDLQTFATTTNEEGEVVFKDSEKARHALANISAKIDIMIAVGEGVQYANIDEEQALYEGLVAASLKKMEASSDAILNEARKNKEFDTEAYKKGVDSTYGRALEDAVKEKIGAFEQIREQLNQAVAFMNLIFEEDFNRRIKLWETAKGRVATDPVRKRILNKMIKDGLVPLVKSPLSKDTLDSIEVDNFGRILLKNDLEIEEKGRAYFSYPRTQNQSNEEGEVGPALDADGNPVESLSIVSLLQVMAPNQDIGIAALVKMIHSSDGATMAQLLEMHEVLGVHDAIIGNPMDILDAGRDANQSFYETQRDWNLGQEIYTSLHRMLPLLAREDSRLSYKSKEKIVKAFTEAIYKGNYSKKMSIDEWVVNFAHAVRENNRNRAELFNEVTVSHQFAFPTTEYIVPENAEEFVPEEVPNSISLRHMITQAVDEQSNYWADITKQIAGYLRQQNENDGNPTKTLARFIDSEHPPAEVILDLIWQAFVNTDSSPMSEADKKRFQAVINVIRPSLGRGDGKAVNVVMRKDEGMSAPAQYDPDTDTIFLSDSIDTMPMAFLHEAIHAANWRKLHNLKKHEPEEFAKLVKAARDWTNSKSGHSVKGANRKLAAQIEVLMQSSEEIDVDELIESLGYSDTAYSQALTKLYLQGKEFEDGDVRAVAEYTAWLNATIKDNGKFAWDGAQALEAFQVLSSSLVDKNGNNVFYSGPRGVVHEAFVDEGQEVTASSFAEIIEDLKLLDGLAPGLQEHYQDLIALLTPGLESVDRIVLKIRDNPNEAASGGALVVTPTHLEIQLESAGNKLSNPNMMSRQEALLHELIHAMFLTAIEHDTKTQDLLERFYERVRDHVNENGGWRVFAPENPSPEERVLAEERYEYLFGITKGPNGEARDASKHLHEFAAIGLTDPFLYLVLKEMKPEKTDTTWEDGFLTGLLNILDRVAQWIVGAIDGSNKNMYNAMTQLAGHVIAYNTKHKKISDQDMQTLRLQRTLDAIDNKAVQMFLKLKNKHITAWAMANGLSGEELNRALEEENSQFKSLVKQAKSVAANGLQANMEGFRAALEDAASGLQKDHWLFEVLTEIMPWAETNHNWIDMLRESEVKIDMVRQQLIEHNRTAINKFFGIGTVQKRFTDREREAISHVMYYTDLSALKTGANGLSDRGILNLIADDSQVDARIAALETKLGTYGTAELQNLWGLHAAGLARLMVNSVSEGVALQTQNVYQMVEQWFYQDPSSRVYLDDTTKEEVSEILEHLITLKALKEVPTEIREIVHPIMVKQMDRTDGLENGFEALLGMHLAYKQASLVNNFENNPASMWKGYVKEIYDDDIDVQVRPNRASDEREMKSQGYRKEAVLPRDPDGPDMEMVIWVNNRGISTYSKAFFSLTDTDSRGTGYFDMFFANEGSNDPSATAARVHRERIKHYNRVNRQVHGQARSGNTLRPGTRMVPVFHPDTGQVVDFRYVMQRETKRKLLKRRDFHDELLPGMIAASTDKENTKTINREGVEMLAKEYEEFRNNDSIRFIQVGKDFDGIAGEMWALLPEDTKMAARDEFGGDFMYVRDDIVNLVFGFRKMTLSNQKWLGPLAPAVRIAERIWQEIIQWERFRIAVLNPAVVVGNIVSNVVVLLVHGVPPRYIMRHYKDAIRGMRKFQRQTRLRNELNAEINAKQARGVSTTELEAKLARLEYYLQSNPVKPLIDEGLFTNIVEEFGVDEKSYRRKISNRLLDAAGGITGSQGLVRTAQELWMTPGSNTAGVALAATQYGDFVARYLKFKWDTEVKGVPRKEAVRTALDTFIFYNIPQNKYLQWLNDNGFMMFTKFFFRIQPIIARLFMANPVRASALFLAQQNAGIQVMGDSVSNYAFMSGLPNKLNLTVWDHVTDGHLLKPNLINWFSWLYDS